MPLGTVIFTSLKKEWKKMIMSNSRKATIQRNNSSSLSHKGSEHSPILKLGSAILKGKLISYSFEF